MSLRRTRAHHRAIRNHSNHTTKTKLKRAAMLVAAAGGLGIQFAHPIYAADRTWSAAAGSSWNLTDLNWNPGPVAWSNAGNDNAFFTTAAGTVNVTDDIIARSITFGITGFTLSGANTITLTSAGAIGGAGPVVGGVINVTTGTATINNPIGGSAGLAKFGTGTLQLFGTNTYTGPTTIGGGTFSGATLAGGNLYINDPGSLPSSTVVTFAGSGTLRIVGGVSSTIGGVSLPFQAAGTTGASTIELQTAAVLNLNGDLNYNPVFGSGSLQFTGLGALNLGSSVRTFNVIANTTGDVTVSSVIQGAGGGILKTGTGTLALLGTNLYTGTTTVGSGILSINASVAANTNGPIGNASSALVLGDSSSLAPATITFGSSLVTFGRDISVVSGNTQFAALNGFLPSLADTVSGNISIAASKELRVSGNLSSTPLTISGNITGGGRFFQNSGNTILTGTNGYTGETFLSAGTLEIRSSTNQSLGSGALQIGAATLLSSTNIQSYGNSLDVLNAASSINTTTNLSLTGSVNTSNYSFGTLTNSQFAAHGTLSKVTGAASLNLSGPIAGGGTLSAAAGTLRVTGAVGSFMTLATTATGSIDLSGTNQTIAMLSGSAGTTLLGTNGILTVGAQNGNGTYSGQILGTAVSGAGAKLIKTGLGSLTLTGNHTGASAFDGGVEVLSNGGILRFNNGAAFPTTGNFTMSTGGFIGFNQAAGVTSTLLNRFTATNDGIVGLDASQPVGTPIDFSAFANLSGAGSRVRLGTSNTVTYAPTSLTPQGNTYYLGGGGGIMTITNGVLVDAAGPVARNVDFGTSGLVPPGTTILSANNAYTGTTTISAGTVQLGTGQIPNSGSASPLSTGATPAQLGGSYFPGTLSYIGTVTSTNRGYTLGTAGGGIAVSNTGNLTVSGSITGNGPFIKSGIGTLILTGSNSYTGATQLNAGNTFFPDTTTAGATGALILNGGTAGFTTGGTLTRQLYMPGFGGSGGFEIPAGQTVTLDGPAAFGGLNLLNKSGTGTLVIGSAAAIPDGTYIPIALGTIQFNNITKTINGISGGGSVLLGSSAITMAPSGGSTFTPLSYTGIMTGTGSLTYNSFGTFTLSGANTFSGGYRQSSGFLIVGANSTPSTVGATVTSGPLGTGNVTFGSAGTFSAFSTTTAAGFTLANTMSFNGDFTTFFATMAGTFNGATSLGTTNRVMNIVASSSITFGGAISGSGGIVKTSPGTMFSSNVNDFTGAVTVHSGSLNFSNTNAYAGATTVNGGTFALGGAGAALSSSSYDVRGGGTILLDNSVTNTTDRLGGGTIFFNGGAIRETAGTTAITYDEAVGTLNFQSGFSRIELNRSSSTSTMISMSASNLARSPGATAVLAGTSLGSTTVSNPARINISTAADVNAQLVGGGGAPGTSTMSIIPWMVADTSGAGAGNGNSMAVYDVNGFRTLAAGEFITSIPNGNAALNNASISVASTVLNSATTINSLFIGGASTITGDGVLTINSGAIAGTGAATLNNAGYNFATREAVLTPIGTTMTFNGPLTNASNIVKAGTGSLILNAPATGTGGLFMNSGTATINGSMTLGGDLVVNAGIGSAAGSLTTNLILNGTSNVTAGGGLTINGLGTSVPSFIGGSAASSSGAGSVLMQGTASFNGPLVANAMNVTTTLRGSNSFTGVTVNAGTVAFAGTFTNGTNGASVGDMTVNGGTLIFSGVNTFNTNVTVSGSVNAGGNSVPGTLVASGTNTFSGNVTNTGGDIILGGSVLAGIPSALGTGTSPITLTSTGTNPSPRLGANTTVIVQRDISVGGAGTNDPAIVAFAASASIFTGNVSLGRNLSLSTTTTGTGYTFTGNFTGAGGLKVDGGINQLTGTNTYGGATTFNGGTLRLLSNTAGASGSAFTINSGTLALTDGNLHFNNTIGSLSGSSMGTVALGNAILTVGGNNSSTQFDGVITGFGGITKVGTGKLTLGSPVNTYVGPTTINGGTISIARYANINSYAVTVNSSGALAGNGRVQGDVTINSGGHIAPGESVGRIFTAAETWAGGGIYDWEITDALVGEAGNGVRWDHIQMSSLTISATSGNKFTIKLNTNGVTPANFNPAPADPINDSTWTIATASGGITGFDITKFSIDFTNFVGIAPGGHFILSTSGNDLRLTYVPEPASGLMIMTAAAAMMRRRRRRR